MGTHSTPTGFCPKALGCPVRGATQGKPTFKEQPCKGCVQWGHNPCRVDDIRSGNPRVAPQAGQPRAPRQNPFGIGMKTRAMGQESQPLEGALVGNMPAEFPRLSLIGFGKGVFPGWLRFRRRGRSPHGCSEQPQSCGCRRCGENCHAVAALLLPRQEVSWLRTRSHHNPRRTILIKQVRADSRRRFRTSHGHNSIGTPSVSTWTRLWKSRRRASASSRCTGSCGASVPSGKLP